MLKTMKPDVHKRLEEIGFEQDEIALFDIIHQFKEQQLLEDLREVIREYSFRRMMAEATQTWDANQWNEGQIFDLVERHRQEKARNEGCH
jgi:hypothetical protein